MVEIERLENLSIFSGKDNIRHPREEKLCTGSAKGVSIGNVMTCSYAMTQKLNIFHVIIF